ncbi:MAG: PAS domain S-box protein [bacterium]
MSIADDRAEGPACRQALVLGGINRIFREALTCTAEEDLERICLAVAEEVTSSKFGFLGELDDEGRSDLVIRDFGWGGCGMAHLIGHRIVCGGSPVHGIYGRVLADGKGFYTNSPSSHPDRVGLPDGHPKLESFLGVPLIDAGRTIGMVGVANRPGGYRDEDLQALEAIAPAVVQALSRKRAEQKLRESEHRYRSLFEDDLTGDFVATPGGKILDCNSAFLGIFGFETKEEALNTGFAALYPKPEERAAFLKLLRRHRRLENYRCVRRRRDGCDIQIVENVVGVFAPSGDLIQLKGYVYDDTDRSRAEEALRESEKRYRSLVDLAPDAVVVHRGGRFLYANDSALKLLGAKSFEELSGVNVIDMMWNDDRQRVLERIRAVEGGSKAPLAEFNVLRLNGEVVPIESTAAPIEWQGKPAVQVIGRDITERKRAEKRLAADLDALTRMHALSTRSLELGGLESLLQEIMETAVAIVDAEQGTLRLVEGNALRRVAHRGHDPSFLEFFATAENRASVCVEALKLRGRVIVEDVEASPLFAGTPSLEVLRQAGVRSVQSTPLLSRTGVVLGTLTTHWDVPHVPDEHDLWRLDLLARQAADLIERSRAEEALRQSEEKARRRAEELARLMDLVPNAVWVSNDPECAVITGNRAAQGLYEASAEENLSAGAIGGDPDFTRRFFRDGRELRPEELPMQQAAAKGTEVRACELDVLLPSGRMLTMLGNASPLFDARGAARGSISAFLDITDRKRMEDDLRRSRDELEERVQERTAELAKVNEELRHLSAKVLASLENERRFLAKEIHDSVGQILVAVKYRVEEALLQVGKGRNRARLKSLEDVIPVLQKSVEEVRRVQMSLRPSMLDDFGLLATIHWFCREYQVTFPRLRLQTELHLRESDLPEPLKIVIFRIIQEAMNNAGKHSKASQVRLRLAETDGTIELTVRDDGEGFDVAKALTVGPFGRGLGLSSMRERAEHSGGSLRVESAEDEGTTVRAFWPLGITR